MMCPDSESTTITGKPITAPVAFRLPTSDYARLQERAATEGKSVSALLQEWVTARLNSDPTPSTSPLRQTFRQAQDTAQDAASTGPGHSSGDTSGHSFQPGDTVLVTGRHPWAGHAGTYEGKVREVTGRLHRVELANGHSCLAELNQLKRVDNGR